MKKSIVAGLVAAMVACGAQGADQVAWFAENATSVATALEAQGKTDDGTWTQREGLSAGDGLIRIDADETPVAYAPDAELEGDAATLTFEDTTFDAAYDELPEIPESSQAGIVLKKTESGAVFAVVENGSWKVTSVAADSTKSYTIVCKFTYGETGADVEYSYDDDGTPVVIASVANTATDRLSTLKFGGAGSVAALNATCVAPIEPAEAMVTDTEAPTIDDVTFDVAKVFTAGDALETAETFEGWTADFAVTVDRDVAEGALALAGNVEGWMGFPMGALTAGEPFMLLKTLAGEDVPYGMVVMMRTFPCALANLNVTEDTTITVTLVATNGNKTKTLASFDYEIKAKKIGPTSEQGTIGAPNPSTGVAEFVPADPATTVATIALNGFTGKILIPSTIETLVGVPADQVYVKNAKGNVIDASAFVGGDETAYSTALTAAAQNPPFVTTDEGETQETPFVVKDGDVALGVQTIVGLIYQLKMSTSLGASAKWDGVGDRIEGDGGAMELKVENVAESPSAFFKVEVTK